MRRRLHWIATAAGITVLLGSGLVSANAAAPTPSGRPQIRMDDAYEDAGFQQGDTNVTTSARSFTSVVTVPQVLCDRPTDGGWTIYVVLDQAHTDALLVELDIDGSCAGSTPQYAIQGFFSGDRRTHSVPIAPGDQIELAGHVRSGHEVYRFTNLTKNKTMTQTGPIENFAIFANGMLFDSDAYAQFTPVNFQHVTFGNQPLAAGDDLFQFNAVDESGDLLATTSSLGSDGESFTITDAIDPARATMRSTDRRKTHGSP